MSYLKRIGTLAIAAFAILVGTAQMATAQSNDNTLLVYAKEGNNIRTFYEYCIGLDCLSNRRAYGDNFAKFKDFLQYCNASGCHSDLFAYTAAFTSAKVFTRYCGPACSQDEVRRASQDEPAIVPYLLNRFDQAPRAGQIFIALVVRIQDRAQGEALLRQLSTIQNEFILIWDGDVGRGSTVGQLAQWFLEHPNFTFER